MTEAAALGRLAIVAERYGLGPSHSQDTGHPSMIVVWAARARGADRDRVQDLVWHLNPETAGNPLHTTNERTAFWLGRAKEEVRKN